MRSIVQPLHLRRVALLLFVGWIIPFIGSLLCFILFTETKNGHQIRVNTIVNSKKTKIKQVSKIKKADNYTLDKRPLINQDSKMTKTITPNNNNIQIKSSSYNNKTLSKNQSSPGSTQMNNSVSAVNNSDINLLARIIYAEARGETLEGQVAVGAVLLNRQKNNKFPNNLWNIIFKKGEFCTVRDGQVWMSPNSTAYKAARLAVNGWDPTYGALYFYNPTKTTSKWIWSRTVTTRIGSHIFAK